MELVEFGELSLREWIALTGREREPFGPAGAGLVWRAKDRHVGLRGDDGRLEAVAGATVAHVDVEGGNGFEVVGVGGLIIRKELRGRGLLERLMDGLKPLVEAMGPDRAMIFCNVSLVAIYARRGYLELPSPVWVDQPDGRVRMPMPAMWRALHAAPTWPKGRIDVQGLPF